MVLAWLSLLGSKRMGIPIGNSSSSKSETIAGSPSSPAATTGSVNVTLVIPAATVFTNVRRSPFSGNILVIFGVDGFLFIVSFLVCVFY